MGEERLPTLNIQLQVGRYGDEIRIGDQLTLSTNKGIPFSVKTLKGAISCYRKDT